MNSLTLQSKTIQVDIQPEEFFRDVKGFPGYQISNYGRVYSLKRNRILNHNIKKSGYHEIGLCFNKARYFRLISRLVFEHFGENPENIDEYQVEHRSRNKDNNHISNLRLATPSQNEANKEKQATYAGNEPSSNYIGVSREGNIWRSRIKVNYKSFSLGNYKHEQNCAWVYNQVARQFKEHEFWLNTLPTNFVLPKETENREQIIQDKITEINNWLNQE